MRKVLARALERFCGLLWEEPAYKPKPPVKNRVVGVTGRVDLELRWFCDICRDLSNGLPVGRAEAPPGLPEYWAVDYCSECDMHHALPESLASHLLLSAHYDVDALPEWAKTGTVFWDGTYLPIAEWLTVWDPRVAASA